MFNDRIKQLRGERQIPQQKLAEVLEIAKNRINK